MSYRNFLLATGLSSLYYLTIRIFVNYGLITGFTLLGDIKPVVYAFYLTYFAYISLSYLDLLSNMVLIRLQSYSKALWWLVKKLFLSNIMFTFVNTLIVVLLLISSDREISLFYTLKFLLLIQMPLLLINMIMVITHLFYNERAAFINGILFFVFGSFIVTFDGSARAYSPIYLYLAPLNTFGQALKLLVIFLIYVVILLGIFCIGLRVKRTWFLKKIDIKR